MFLFVLILFKLSFTKIKGIALHLPAIHLLEAFEAVARQKNLAKASEALFVTVSAVSQRISSLEEHLGVQLFKRSRDGLELTVEGARYRAALEGVLEQILSASETIGRPSRVEQAVRVQAASGFIRYWLLPRVGRFRKAHQGIHLSIVSSTEEPNFKVDPVDIWVRRGRYSSDQSEVELLMPENFIPLCSPAYRNAHSVGSTDQITISDLLRCHRKYPTWFDWFKKEEVLAPQASELMVFANAADALDAALHGLGVVLESFELAGQAIAEKQLVPLLENAKPLSGDGFRVIYPKSRLANEGVKAFRDWLFAEISKPQQY